MSINAKSNGCPEWQYDLYLQQLIDYLDGEAPYFLAWAYNLRGENDLAFANLDKAYEVKDGGLYGILGNRAWSSLVDDPRWLLFLEKIGRSPEKMDAIEFDIVFPEC